MNIFLDQLEQTVVFDCLFNKYTNSSMYTNPIVTHDIHIFICGFKLGEVI